MQQPARWSPPSDAQLRCAGLAIVAGFLLFGSTLVFGQDISTFDGKDEALFHLPTVLQFAEQLPAVDLRDYPAATAPLYHLCLALVTKVVGPNLVVLRGLTLALAACGLWFAHRLVGLSRTGVALVCVLAASPYYVGPAVRLSTDDVALAAVFGCLLLLSRERAWPAGFAAAAAVLVRQVHLWLALPIFVQGWRRDRRAAVAGLVPVLCLAPLVVLWGGPVPPSAVRGHEAATLNLDVALLVVALLGFYGFFLLPAVWREIRAVPALLAAAAPAPLLLLVSPMAYRPDPQRWGGALLTASGVSPDVLGSDLVMWGLVPLGALTSAAGIARMVRDRDWLWVVAPAGFLLANLASDRAYQKYYEPFLIVVVAAWFARQDEGRWDFVGPAILCSAYLAIDFVRFW